MLKRAYLILSFCLLGLMSFGCDSTDTIEPQPIPAQVPLTVEQFTFAAFDPTAGVVPLPNNLLVDNNSNNFPGTGEPFDAMNSIAGFSTSGDLLIPFNGPVDPNTVTNNSVQVYNRATGNRQEMSFQVVNDAAGNSTILATPVLPFAPASVHVVVLSDNLRRPDSGSSVLSNNTIRFSKSRTPLIDSNGNVQDPLLRAQLASGSLTLQQIQGLEQLRVDTQTVWADAENLSGLLRESIPMAFSFTTVTIGEDLNNIQNFVDTTNAGLQVQATLPFANYVAFLQGNGAPANLIAALQAAPSGNINRVVVGTVATRYYRDPNNAGTTFWPEGSGVTAVPRNIPFVAFLPANQNAPALIFQHGLNGSKELAGIIADGFNAQGIGVIAIDLELHGQLAVSATPSTDFINLGNLRNARDNIRQSVVNLYALTQAIVSGQSDFNADTTPDLAPANPLFVGHSLGGIVGTIYVATEDTIGRAVINAAGGRISKLLQNSVAISPGVLQGLAAQGVQPGTARFRQFWLIAQTVADTADPINYAAAAAAKGVLFQGYPTDLVVPGTDTTFGSQADLARAMGQATGFSQVDAINVVTGLPQVTSNFPGSGLFEITTADVDMDGTADEAHGALLGTAGAAKAGAILMQAGAFYQTGTITAPAGIRAREVATPNPVMDFLINQDYPVGF